MNANLSTRLPTLDLVLPVSDLPVSVSPVYIPTLACLPGLSSVQHLSLGC